MNKFYCPICGNQLVEAFSIGDICSCCGNECGCDERIIRELVDGTYDKITLDTLNNISYLTKEEAHEYLRKQWILQGLNWKYNDCNEKPEAWNFEMARKQLTNININLDDYLDNNGTK
ncbi:hypothetical protein [Vallitalea guaymasensis]|uniref:Uncharacterized protein n=1 Tax=Vallitalea guaymasensis TaxID=1185412 RepID=A0A8J8M7Q3_9FIRM|nr:hypothetical protein [Vallitalea guaymasensis]QUH27748.1 hypothetical protein HYG85_01975 [Vallitalea guaymasensis]